MCLEGILSALDVASHVTVVESFGFHDRLYNLSSAEKSLLVICFGDLLGTRRR